MQRIALTAGMYMGMSISVLCSIPEPYSPIPIPSRR